MKVQFPDKAKDLFHPAPYKVMHGGRGSSKSWDFAQALIILGATKPLFILCTREIQYSIKESVHKLLSDRIRDMGWEGSSAYTILEQEIVHANGTRFVFAGIRNNITKIKSYEGIDICAVFEATHISFNSWEVLLPTIRRDPPYGPFGQGSEVWIEFNPELSSDETYKRWVLNPPRGTVVIEINYSDNPWFPDVLRRQMEEMRERDYDSYLTVWEGKTRRTLAGAIYAKEMQAAIVEGRITPHIKVDRQRGVDIAFDLGRSDMMCEWFFQQRGDEHVAVDYYGNFGFDFAHYILETQKRGYIIRRVYLPHDAVQKHASASKSIERQARDAWPGDGRVKIVPRTLRVVNDINAVRAWFPRACFSEDRCADGLLALQHYQYGIDPKKNNERTKDPLHNWASHPADALRTYVMGLRDDARRHEADDEDVERTSRFAEAGGLGWMG